MGMRVIRIHCADYCGYVQCDIFVWGWQECQYINVILGLIGMGCLWAQAGTGLALYMV